MSVNLQTTVVALFHERVTADGTKPALQVKRAGSFEPISWNELSNDVLRTAAGLANVGVRPGDRVVQFSENRYEWIVSDLAIQISQAVHVPLHALLTGQQAAYQINDCAARVVLLSTAEQVEKLAAASDQLTVDSHFFAYDDCRNKVGSQVVRSFEELTNLADAKTGAQLKQQALANLNPGSLATILYTSGTTGEPKGVMLSQGNLTSNALAALEVFQQRSDDVRLSFLPHSHIFARTCDVYTWIATGAQLVLAESRETVIADCQAVQPTLINGVPYFFDKVRRALVDLGREDAESLRDILGGRVRMCCSGGAPLADHVFDFFNDRGVTLTQGYGLTESSPVITA
ncbi:MAG: AMP-binding protein, partial [Planctomycetes bacterium]|nr:AMP-binding protein [Planctomycetota bacterium]